MAQVVTNSGADLLMDRLVRGADLLFDMEQRGETDGRYSRWLSVWLELLTRYEELDTA